MLYDSREDPARLRRAVEKHVGPAAAAFVEQALDLVHAIKADVARAEAIGTAVQKCEALELAKWRLRQFEALARSVPNAEPVGMDEARAKITRLEQTFLALGLYFASGVVRA
jgi:hypothetical protein